MWVRTLRSMLVGLAVLPVAMFGNAWSQSLAIRPEAPPNRIATQTLPDSSVLDRQAALDVRNVSLDRALTLLADVAGIDIAFSPTIVSRTSTRVSCECIDVTVKHALNLLLRGTPFAFLEIRGHVLVYPKSDLTPPTLPRSGQGRLASAAAVQPLPLHALSALPQRTGIVTGRVIEGSSLRPLEGVQVSIPALRIGATTNREGRFAIPDVPVGEHTITADLIGFATAEARIVVVDGQTTVIDLSLAQRAISLGEIVVTGVGTETPRTQLPFTVERVDFTRDMVVVPPSPEVMLQGRVAGVSVVRGSGQPGEGADIVLRGATSISGDQRPLLIVDGVITSGTLGDINPQDIADIEIVKGAAAASLYGSRAQAGVINITTKRSASMPDDQTRFMFRSQYTSNDLPRTQERSRHHYFRVTADGKAFARADGTPVVSLDQRVLDDGGDGSNAMKAFAVNPWPDGFRDPVGQFFLPGSEANMYAALEGRNGGLNYRLSASTGREEGVIRFHEGSRQKSLRFNADHNVNDNFGVAFSGYYANVHQDLISQGAGGVLQTLLTMEPHYNLLEIDTVDGDLKAAVGPPGQAITNFLYQVKTDEDTRDRDRYMGSVRLRYSPLSWLTLEGNVSYDRSYVDERHMRPKGYKLATAGTGEELPPHEGFLNRSETRVDETNTSFTASISRNFGDFTLRGRTAALFEQREEEAWISGGNEFSVYGVPRLSLLRGATQVDNYYNRTVAAGYLATTSVGYKSRYLFDILGRRDGSSLFGVNERWQNYYRFSGAWRMTEEGWWPFEFFDEFKPRYSHGTAGGRPRYEAQYQTYAADRGQISPRILGNADLKPELATERELGLDIALLNQRLSGRFNYVNTNVQDQILLTPLAGYYGFTAQWRNAGTIDSKTWEASIEAALIERPNLVWTSLVNVDRTTQIISKLNVPNFQVRHYRSTMYVVEGEPLGVFFGKRWASKCEDLPTTANCGDFDRNDDGYLVYVGAGNSWRDGRSKNLWGTLGQSGGTNYQWGIPTAAAPWPEVTKLGNSTPDFSVGWSNTVRWRQTTLTVLFHGEFGSQVYFGSGQWQANAAYASASHDQSGKPEHTWKPTGYYGVLYDVNVPNDHWLRDASFIKIREMSVRHTFPESQVARVFGRMAPTSASVNLVARNLKTWTDYEGYDPEVGRSDFFGSAIIGRIDEQSYPNYRSLGLSIELVF